jgi:hypothetical protein
MKECQNLLQICIVFMRNKSRKSVLMNKNSDKTPRIRHKHSKKNVLPKVQKSSEEAKSIQKQNTEGDKIFKEKLSGLNSENCNQSASQYFKLAYRNIRLLHFHDETFAQKSYFMTTNPLVRELKCYLCWLYILLTFFEPSNSSDTSIDRTSTTFL